MYITTGGIEQLIKWFDNLKSYQSPNTLCLVVGGHLNDSKFFEEIFDNKDALDTISGKDVLIFLFAKENIKHRYNEEVSLVSEGGGTFRAYPVEFPKELIKNNDIRILRVSQLSDNRVKNNIIQSSQNIASEIVDFFKLSISELPCILLKHRYWDDVLRIETKGMVNVDDFASFLKEIAILSERFSEKIPRWILPKINKLQDMQASEISKTVEIKKEIYIIRSMLIKNGMSVNEFQKYFSLYQLPQIFYTLGCHKHEEQNKATKYYEILANRENKFDEIFNNALQNQNFKRACRIVKKQSCEIIDMRNNISSINEQLKSNGIADIKQINPELQILKDDVNKICNKYGFKFNLRKQFNPISKFINHILYGSKEVLSKEVSLEYEKHLLSELPTIMTEKILFFTSNPSNTSRLRVDREVREIEEGLKRANKRDNFDFKVKLATRPRDLSRAILEENPQILHFSGHGETEGIILEDENGVSKVVSTDAIGKLFSLFGNTIKCVILNSCYSISQAQEIVKHIPFVIGMNKAVPDTTAIAFATSFYDAIGAGRDIEFAFKFGVSNISLEGLRGYEIPVLLKKEN
jgi:hypothetical protein